VQILNAVLSPVFVPSAALLLEGDHLTLDFLFDANGTVQWYLEFTGGDPNDAATQWYREVSEESAGGGAVAMAPVVRTFTVTAVSRALSTQFVRKHKLARVQISASIGTPRAMVFAPFGLPTNA
jgi:hypothetical protein